MKEQIIKRLDQLYMVLKYSSEKTAMLKIGERIYVNQERASLYRLLEGEETEFIQSESVLKKIDKILELIERTNWIPKEDYYD